MLACNPPVYEFEVMEYGGHRVLCILDRFDEARPTMTVTNAVEVVLAQIAAQLGTLPELIIYRDSYGEWDRLLSTHEGGFQGFCPIVTGRGERITDGTEALQLLIANLADSQGSHH